MKRFIPIDRLSLPLDSLNNIERIMRKSEQHDNIHNPYYLLYKGYVKDTPLMRIFAKDVLFCRYSFQKITSDNYLTSDVTDYDKLQHILLYEYGLKIDIERFFRCHRLYRLMQYVENNTSHEHLRELMARESKEQKLRQKLFQMFTDCCDDRTPHLDSNPAFTGIDFEMFNSKLYRQYHIYLSTLERRVLNEVRAIITHIVFRLKDGGKI